MTFRTDKTCHMSAIYTSEQIATYMPHRYPFRLVDRVTSLTPWKAVTAYKNVTVNEEFFLGHFPERPVMPGVLILEAMAQAALLMLVISFREHASECPEGVSLSRTESGIFYLASCDKVKFRRPVTPGDRLDLAAELTRPGGNAWKVRAEATVDGNKAAEAQILAAL
ncbi:MAG: 3-hydroxyacyl-ACP dehydratase FabZ [Deltaproteobacteria bacterium]|jgi:3-hydroxyacyl-[acyl-carrier-protein] dehydratase|nr:3-hydroxyacyl-ACP dehydratase FabZ [Deltaproteobacteria bacterium]